MITSQTRIAGPFTGTGLQAAFPFAFKVFQSSDLLVVQTDANGNATNLTLTSQYSVLLNADQDNQPGGSITLTSALAPGYKLTISSKVPALQGVDLTNVGSFYPGTINNALDYLTILIQQLIVQLGNCLQVSLGAGTVNAQIPPPTPLALLGWDASGTQIVNSSAAALGATLASFPASFQIFSGNGTQTVFTLSSSPGSIANTDVYLSGVRQLPGIDYTIVGFTATMTNPPPVGTNNLLVVWNTAMGSGAAAASAAAAAASLAAFKNLYYGPLAADPTTRPDGTAMQAGDTYWSTSATKMRVYNGAAWQSYAPSAPSAQAFSGTGSQTVFTLATSPTSAASLIISIGGVMQRAGSDFTVSGTTLTFTSAPPAGTNNINVVNFG